VEVKEVDGDTEVVVEEVAVEEEVVAVDGVLSSTDKIPTPTDQPT